MATTKILPVRKRLKDCLDYAANPKKTEVFRGDALDRQGIIEAFTQGIGGLSLIHI